MLRQVIASVAMLVLSATFAQAQHIQHSAWESEYQTTSGQWVQADLRLNGSDGTYHTYTGQRGRLYNIQYQQPGPHDPQGIVVVTGCWQFENGSSGEFKFYVDQSGSQFSGYWWYSQSGGPPALPWNGRPAGGPPLPSPY